MEEKGRTISIKTARNFKPLGQFLVIISGLALIGWAYYVTRSMGVFWAFILLALMAGAIEYPRKTRILRPLVQGLIALCVNLLIAFVIYYSHDANVLWFMILGIILVEVS